MLQKVKDILKEEAGLRAELKANNNDRDHNCSGNEDKYDLDTAIK